MNSIHHHRRAIALVVASSFFFAATSAVAQSKPEAGSDNRALAETLFFTARGLMEAGRFAEACVKLAESYRLDPGAGTLLNLAVCHEKEGKTASAWGEFLQARNDAKRMGRADREQLASEHIAALEPELPKLAIEVPASVRVPGLTITRNGVKLEQAAWATELPVDPGKVEIVASAPGYKPRTKTVQIERKGHLSVSIDALEEEPIPEAPVEYWTGKRKTGLVLVSTGIAAIGVGTYFGLSALSLKSKSDDQCPVFDGERRCTSAGSDNMAKAKTSAWVSDVAIGVGAVTLITGAYLFLSGAASKTSGHDDDKTARASSSWAWNVSVGPAGGGAFVSHAF